MDMNIGVPQSSALVPILILIVYDDTFCRQHKDFLQRSTSFEAKSSRPHIEEWCLASKLILNYTKTFQVVVKAPNQVI